MTEYTIDNEGTISSVASTTEFHAFDAGNTNRVKKATAAQLATFIGANAAPTTLPAGTVSAAPLTFTSGSLLTTPVVGATEFDGTALYFSPAGNTREQVDAEQFTIASADSAAYNNTGLDTNAAAAVFTATMGAAANGALTLIAGKTYAFEACYCLTNTGTTSHTWAALFGGTATFTRSMLQAFGISTTGANAPATGGLTGFATGTDLTFSGSGIVCTAASTSATEQVTIQLQGTLVCNAGGTLIPQLKASARPGASGTPGVVVKAGSFFRIWGMSSSAQVGNWS
jgi:hypothetical protein